MPSVYQRLTEMLLSELVWDSAKIELNRFAQLLPTDESGEVSFSPEGKYRESSTIEFPNMVIRGLVELFSMEADVGFIQDEDEEDLGSVDFQLSNDDGATYLYYNAGWVTAGANDWSSEADVQTNIATFPFVAGSEKQVRIKVRLNPDVDGKASPFLTTLALHYEVDFIPEEDVVRSVKSHISNNVEVITEVGIQLAEASDKIRANIDAEITEVIGAFNITTDPGRLNNIYSALDKTLVETKDTGEEIWQQDIELTTAGAADDVILARVKIKVEVYKAPDADYTLGELPKIVLEIGDHSEDNDFRNDGRKIEKNKALSIARIRDFPQTYRMPVRSISYSSDDLLAMEINKALVRALKDNKVVSLATAERLQVIETEEYGVADVVREDLSVKVFSFEVVYRDWVGDYEQVPLVETFIPITDIGGR